MSLLLCVLIGFLGGLVGGSLGLGGGAVMVPLLVYWIGLTQHQAQGTVLAVLTLPVLFLAAYRYHLSGNIKLQVAFLMAMGFIVGALLGAHLIQNLPEATLKRLFGIFLILIGIKMALLK